MSTICANALAGVELAFGLGLELAEGGPGQLEELRVVRVQGVGAERLERLRQLFVGLLHRRANIGPRLEQAKERGEPRPYIKLRYPQWVRKVAATWIALFTPPTVATAILLVIAAVELRLG